MQPPFHPLTAAKGMRTLSKRVSKQFLSLPGLERMTRRCGSRWKASTAYNKMSICAPYNNNFLPALDHFGFTRP